MSLEQGMAHLVSKTWKDIRKQEFVPCWKLDEKAKRHTSERYMLMKTFISTNKNLVEPISSEVPIKFM